MPACKVYRRQSETCICLVSLSAVHIAGDIKEGFVHGPVDCMDGINRPTDLHGDPDLRCGPDRQLWNKTPPRQRCPLRGTVPSYRKRRPVPASLWYSPFYKSGESIDSPQQEQPRNPRNGFRASSICAHYMSSEPSWRHHQNWCVTASACFCGGRPCGPGRRGRWCSAGRPRSSLSGRGSPAR